MIFKQKNLRGYQGPLHTPGWNEVYLSGLISIKERETDRESCARRKKCRYK